MKRFRLLSHLLALAVGFGLSWLILSPHDSEGDPNRAQEQQAMRADSEAAREATPSAALASRSISANTETTPAPSAATLREALAQPNRLDRLSQFTALIAEMDASQAPELFAELMSRAPSRTQSVYVELLAAAWVRLDPDRALAAMMEHTRPGTPLDPFAWGAALEEWGTIDPRAALAWVETEAPEELASFKSGLYQGWFRSDPQGLLAHAATLEPDSRERYDTYFTLGSSIATLPPEEARRLLLSQPAGAQRDTLIHQTVRQMNLSGGATASAFLDSLGPGNQPVNAVASVASNWAEYAPAEAALWLMEMEESPQQRRGLRSLAGQVASESLEDAALLLNALPQSPVLDAPLAAASQTAMQQYRDVDTAFAWANRIGDEAQRAEALSNLYRFWIRFDAANAQASLALSKLNSVSRQKITDRLDETE